MPRGQRPSLRPINVKVKLLENRIKHIDNQIKKYTIQKEIIQHTINIYLGKMESVKK